MFVNDGNALHDFVAKADLVSEVDLFAKTTSVSYDAFSESTQMRGSVLSSAAAVASAKFAFFAANLTVDENTLAFIDTNGTALTTDVAYPLPVNVVGRYNVPVTSVSVHQPRGPRPPRPSPRVPLQVAVSPRTGRAPHRWPRWTHSPCPWAPTTPPPCPPSPPTP